MIRSKKKIRNLSNMEKTETWPKRQKDIQKDFNKRIYQLLNYPKDSFRFKVINHGLSKPKTEYIWKGLIFFDVHSIVVYRMHIKKN